jgi:sulfite reductase (NADPH) flavoprotein alpha-component
VKFFESVRGAADGSLSGLQFAALGLGDKSYQIFCGAAVELEKELIRLGGKTFQEIALFDVDYAAHTPKWVSQTVETLNKVVGDTAQATTASFAEAPTIRTGKGYTRLEPVPGRIKHIVNLNDIDSRKQTYHIEIAYDDSVPYSCGDAAGIILPLDAEGKEPNTPALFDCFRSLHARERGAPYGCSIDIQKRRWQHRLRHLLQISLRYERGK